MRELKTYVCKACGDMFQHFADRQRLFCSHGCDRDYHLSHYNIREGKNIFTTEVKKKE